MINIDKILKDAAQAERSPVFDAVKLSSHIRELARRLEVAEKALEFYAETTTRDINGNELPDAIGSGFHARAALKAMNGDG